MEPRSRRPLPTAPRSSVTGVANSLRELERIPDGNGNSVVKVQGISFGRVSELRGLLDHVSTKLAIHGSTWQEHHTPDLTADFDPDDVVDDEWDGDLVDDEEGPGGQAEAM